MTARAVVLGALVSLALVEAGLRLAAAASPRGAPSNPEPTRDGRPVVLFLGDSHLYGAHVTRPESMPGLAAALATRYAPRGILAVNRGRVGGPSWIARERAMDAIGKLRPAAVVVRAGLDNRAWADPDRESGFDGLRIERLVRLAWRGDREAILPDDLDLRDPGFVIGGPRDPGAETREAEPPRPLAPVEDRKPYHAHARARPGLRRDLVGIAEEARRGGALPIFVGYFTDAPACRPVDEDLVWVAEATGAPFLDLGRLFRELIATRPRGDLVFDDQHPTPLGCAVAASELVRLLVEQKVLSGSLSPSGKELLAGVAPERIELGLDAGSAEAPTLVIRGKPACRGYVLAGAPGGMLAPNQEEIALANDARLARFPFQFDAQGLARVKIPDAVRRGDPSATRAIAMMEVRRSGAPPRTYVSRPLDLPAPPPAAR